MATILSKKLGYTIISDKFTSLEAWAKTLPGAEDLAKEKARAEMEKKEASAQKRFNGYRKTEPKDYARALEIDTRLSSLPYAPLKYINKNNNSIHFNHIAHSFKKCHLTALVITGKEIKCNGWENALKWFLIQLNNKAAERLWRWKRKGLLNWMQIRDVLKKKKWHTKVQINIPPKTSSKVVWKIRTLQWLLCMAGFNLEDITIKFYVPEARNEVKLNNVSRALIDRGVPKRSWQSVAEQEALEQRPLSFDGWVLSPNGTVERVKSGRFSDHEIARSSSDSEDTWIGMGHFARDNGRFGSICGEDYAD